MPQPDQAIATLAAYRASTTALRAQLLGFLRSLWSALGVYRDAQMADFVESFTPLLQGAEQQMVALTTGYLHQLRQPVAGEPIDPLVVDPSRLTGSATRKGTEPADVYERPFGQVWREIAAGQDPQTAIEHGLQRAEKAALTDLQRTKALTVHETLTADPQVVGWRRVLEGTHSCGLCIVSSTQRYHKDTLLPVHPGCDCDVAPIYGEDDPGQVINLELLQDVHAAIEAAFGISNPSAAGYLDLIITHEHGELGPVLARRGHHFTGPNDI